ncbi:hypothetical protein C9374_011796 [Naegleria lovaniensis]|uniref:Uncharacterized protein n=1 Tax=Naegleria lovaniensis TaxID=51637 RepID=A0AA88GDR5_NAELO|nr:uncharacterized protein C9374_011796 [Naegleria lovaniensis]KAG2373707.1 hypothetical protein C9374_011796 [Naegleria lovaniensis]
MISNHSNHVEPNRTNNDQKQSLTTIHLIDFVSGSDYEAHNDLLLTMLIKNFRIRSLHSTTKLPFKFSAPFDVTISYNCGCILVNDRGTQSIEVFDLITRQHKSSLSVKNFFPHYLCIEENYNGEGDDALLMGHLETTLLTSYCVCKVDLNTFLSTGNLSFPFLWQNKKFTREALGMCIVTNQNGDRELVVCDSGNCFLRVLDLTTGVQIKIIQCGFEPCHVCNVFNEELVISYSFVKGAVKMKKANDSMEFQLLCGDRSTIDFYDAYSIAFDSYNNRFIVSDPSSEGKLKVYTCQGSLVNEFKSFMEMPKGLCFHKLTREIFVCVQNSVIGYQFDSVFFK